MKHTESYNEISDCKSTQSTLFTRTRLEDGSGMKKFLVERDPTYLHLIFFYEKQLGKLVECVRQIVVSSNLHGSANREYFEV